jgi:hypothetical protein
MSEDLYALLKRADPENPESVSRVIAALEGDEKALETKVARSIAALRFLSRSYEATVRRHDRLQSYVDRDVDAHIERATQAVSDYPSARRTIDTFSQAYFTTLPYSVEGKVRMAAALLRAIAPYNLTQVLWSNIVARDPDTVTAIEYGGNDAEA